MGLPTFWWVTGLIFHENSCQKIDCQGDEFGLIYLAHPAIVSIVVEGYSTRDLQFVCVFLSKIACGWSEMCLRGWM